MYLIFLNNLMGINSNNVKCQSQNYFPINATSTALHKAFVFTDAPETASNDNDCLLMMLLIISLFNLSGVDIFDSL